MRQVSKWCNAMYDLLDLSLFHSPMEHGPQTILFHYSLSFDSWWRWWCSSCVILCIATENVMLKKLYIFFVTDFCNQEYVSIYILIKWNMDTGGTWQSSTCVTEAAIIVVLLLSFFSPTVCGKHLGIDLYSYFSKWGLLITSKRHLQFPDFFFISLINGDCFALFVCLIYIFKGGGLCTKKIFLKSCEDDFV